MKFKDLLFKETPESGLTMKGKSGNRFRLTRILDESGQFVYILENVAKGQRIYIDKYLFDRFRAKVVLLPQSEHEEIDEKVFFGETCHYRFRTDKMKEGWIVIQSEIPREGSTAILEYSMDSTKKLASLLYDERLEHTSGTLDRIVSYHQLFQFSFLDGGKSINSELITKKNILYTIENFQPSLSKLANWNNKEPVADWKNKTPLKKKTETENNFKAKLGEKVKEKAYQVDYDSLFKKKDDSKEEDSASKPKRRRRKNSPYFSLPVLASEVKMNNSESYKCELTLDERLDYEETFPPSKKGHFYLGIEIIDAVFKKAGQLKTFKFPLYYLKVDIIESGRTLYIKPQEKGRVYLNHVALANLVDQFASRKGLGNPVDLFFQKLNSQVFEFNGGFDRIRLTRNLPHDEEIFKKTRHLFFGKPNDKENRGMFENLKIVGVEVDLESTFLYKVEDNHSILSHSLNRDLGLISSKAHDNPEKFYQTLLGQFLNPEIESKKKNPSFCDRPYMPGRLAGSMKTLLDRMNEHDIILLEGPPGTGKTFSILNILIHCVCTGKRVLITSDQMGAIHALTEKIQEYLMGKDRKSEEAMRLDQLWQNAIKVIDELPNNEKVSTWALSLKKMLKTESHLEPYENVTLEDFEKTLKKIDEDILSHIFRIQTLLNKKLAGPKDDPQRVAKKNYHATTEKHITSLIKMLDIFRKNDKENLNLFFKFINIRKSILKDNNAKIYQELTIPQSQADWKKRKKDFVLLRENLELIKKEKPRDLESFKVLVKGKGPSPFYDKLIEVWSDYFRAHDSDFKKTSKKILSYIHHPGIKLCDHFLEIINLHLYILENEEYFEISETLLAIHKGIDPNNSEDLPLDLEFYRYLRGKSSKPEKESIQGLLFKIEELQKERDLRIKDCFMNRLKVLEDGLTKVPKNSTTARLTRVHSLLNELEKIDEMDQAWPIMRDLQQTLLEAFPIWICRKQAVSFLFPTQGQIFDLVIVDEATQCKVDDALSLIYRGSKLMAVGDDKQTVLAKDSVLDDYLFNEFDLSEHLRFYQASSVKGGGSHLFGLVRNIKKTSVMLNEHYRCPPEVIDYSNRYVYDNKLFKMQWRPQKSQPSVVVDFSEKSAPKSVRKTSGTYKGLETEMLDRFLEYVIEEVQKIEREENKKINSETDIALCYFLLKNEPYVDAKKSEFLAKLKRGDDILHGAGAALQGKERDYIFYYWDVSKSNMAAFSQGDDELKRKGELNVLMSRPKIRAYHFLHGEFDKLNHSKISITDYLWKTYQSQSLVEKQKKWTARKENPGPHFTPWRRTSGELMKKLLEYRMEFDKSIQFQNSVVVGNPNMKIDLVISNDKEKDSLGLVDVSGFRFHPEMAQDVVDYYFQILRSSPSIAPYFLFLYELMEWPEELVRWLNREEMKKAS
ncbi:MAG: hypothetical protein H6621_07705 [Halobacteriovoraceae bacterium]|nr:hypothetical protein [Halobacteriovoraceae bacterium]